MAERDLWLDPDRVHRAAADLARSGTTIGAEWTGLGGEIEAASATQPWGTDDIGAAFERQYRGLEAAVLATWRGVGSRLEQLGGDLADSVEATVATDAASGHRIGRSAT
ncbi:hypothetical protein ACI2K4_11540 [Micromonospora sp. NPDC050397]|uniref:hypothetical protein n=1 Tax=Micromonospora sp. NPDC050397 TaxID=3364279 RepID=UPI00384C42F7